MKKDQHDLNFELDKNECSDNIDFRVHGHNLLIKNEGDSENLYFAFHSVVKITIPSSVTQINPYSFDKCQKLKTIKFTDDSQLKTIKHNSFSGSNLKELINIRF